MGSWSKIVVLGVIVSATLLFGCRRRYDPLRSPGRLQRYEENLIQLASRDTGCSPVQVQPVRIAERVWTANTCTGPREYFLHCRSRGRRWANCRWWRIGTVGDAAAPVLQCPPPSIGQQLGAAPTERWAAGCGRTVPVELRCNTVGCGWIATRPVQGTPSGPVGGANVVIVPAPPQ